MANPDEAKTRAVKAEVRRQLENLIGRLQGALPLVASGNVNERNDAWQVLDDARREIVAIQVSLAPIC